MEIDPQRKLGIQSTLTKICQQLRAFKLEEKRMKNRWNNFHFPPPPSSVVFRKWPSETTTGRDTP